jgi:membrane protein
MGGNTRKKIQSFYYILKESAINFDRDGVVKYSASLSFYTIFSIAPMLIIAIGIGSFLFGKDAIKGHLFGQINKIVGNETALELQEMLKHTTLHRDNALATAIGVAVFFIGATGVFGEIQSTINKIWGLKAKPKKGIIRYLINRILSFAMVVSTGFLMVVSLMASTVIEILNEKLNAFLPDTTLIILVANYCVSLVIIAFLFLIVFKYLPDSKVKLSDALVGSLFTSALFLLGKSLIGLYMANSTSASVYGAAGSIIILLLWVYYSSMLLYFGAEFTKVYALTHGHGIRPNNYSVRVEYKEKEIVYTTHNHGPAPDPKKPNPAGEVQ